MAGYSETPLIKKLGFKPPLCVLVVGAPAEYPTWLGALPPDLSLSGSVDDPVRAAHVFAVDQHVLAGLLSGLRGRLAQNGFAWVSWPKKTAKVDTNLTEDVIREIALPMGFVDIKVCAVSEIWSGLKLVIRKSERA